MTEQVVSVEQLYQVLDQTTSILQKELSLPYLEALIKSGENLYSGTVLQDITDVNKQKLKKQYNLIDLSQLTKEQIRKALQLVILKGMKEATQPHHMMTPDAVSLFISYVIEKLTENKESFSVMDPAIGTGNLMMTILNQVKKDISAYGVEVDDTLINLSYINANLQQNQIELFRQDSLQSIFVDPVDVIVSDLPVGFYPNDDVAKRYELQAKEGHSYAHHLFIEQSINHTKNGGYLIFLIPNFLFVSEESKRLNEYIKKHAVILGLLQLPLTMFKDEKFAKSIFILQKKGEGVLPPKQALLVDLPKFSNEQAMQAMIQKINQWFEEELNIHS